MPKLTTTHSSGQVATRTTDRPYRFAGWRTDANGVTECKVYSETKEGAEKGIAAWVRVPKKFLKLYGKNLPQYTTEITPVTVAQ